MGASERFREVVVDKDATFTASATSDAIWGFGKFNQIFARLEVGTCTGGADTYDCKIQTRLGDTWVDIITFTQATAATTENKGYLRNATQGWGNELRVVRTVGAGATVTGVDLTITGACA